MSGEILSAAWVPGLPHVLHYENNPDWSALNEAYSTLGERIASRKPDVLVVYSSQWLSVLGTSFQNHPHPKGVHVDENWYDLGDLAFDFTVDTTLSERFAKDVAAQKFPTKTVNYDQFPIDTATIIALRYLNPNGNIPVSIVSSWVYADAAATSKIGATMRQSVQSTGKRAVFVAVSALSSRYWTTDIDPIEDFCQEQDEAWNKKTLSHFESGDFGKLSMVKEVPTEMQFNAYHWLAGALEGSEFKGETLAYGPLWGTGAAVVEFLRRG